MDNNLKQSDSWLDRQGPEDHVVASSRSRYARNFPKIPFPLRARPEELRDVVERASNVIGKSPLFADGHKYDLAALKPIERNFLKENHLISVEMEKGLENRMIFLSKDVRLAVMLNEEDHLRIFALEAGFQPYETLNNLIGLDEALNRELGFAFSTKFGFLTACPTNTGTGLRSSVMLHLPALAMTKKLQELIKTLPQIGLTVRGSYGENSENNGDFFQISNEVTLGRSEEEILQTLTTVVEQVIQREEQARRLLFEQNRNIIEDEVWRAFGILSNARILNSQEAVQLLSKLRFGIDQKYFGSLSHRELNKLIVNIQPGHLQTEKHECVGSEERDVLRAQVLRERLSRIAN